VIHDSKDVELVWVEHPSDQAIAVVRGQRTTFSIEFVNVSPDAEGNPANHIHCV